MKFFKEIKEAYNKRDAYQRDYDSSVAGMGKRQSLAYQLDGGANDEGWDRPEYRAPEYTYYIRFKDTGAVYKQKGAPKSFANKAAANAYALAMIKNNPGLKGNLLLTVDAEDKKSAEIKEANYDDPKFNPRIEQARIVNLKLELADADPNRREEIAREIKQIEAQLRLYAATQPEKPAPVKDKRSDDGTPYTMYFDGEVSGRMLDTDLQGAKNTGKHTVMRQLAHTFVIVTDNQGEVVFVWYPGGHERPYEVGDKYNAPGAPDPYKDRPRYPEGHPHAGAPMPANVPVTTDWSKLPDGGIEAWMQGKPETEVDSAKESIGESAEDLPMYGAIIHRIMVAHTDLLAKYGPEKIMAAAEDEAEWVGDVEEIGTSDVSISVKRVIQALEEQHGLKEFAPGGSNDGDDGFSEETLKQLASQWYNGDEDPRVEKTLAAAGWEIGQDEGYNDEPGVFVVQAGDVNGNSYISWPANKLREGVSEGSESPEAELERLKLRQNAWKKAPLRDQAATQARIRELEKQIKDSVAEGSNPTDVINVDVPMLLRVMEFAREDAQSDVDLHKVAERLTQLSADGHTVTIDDYNAVVGEIQTKVEEADMATGNQGYDNMLAVMKAVDAGQDAKFMLNGEPITLEYPEARFLAGKYKAFLRAGRQEEFLKYMDDPVMFDRLMKQLRDLIDKQKNFRGSVPGERGVEEAAPAMAKLAGGLGVGLVAAAGAPAIVSILGPLLGIPMAAYGAYSAAKLGMKGVEKLWDMATDKLGSSDEVEQYANAQIAKLPPQEAQAAQAVIKQVAESKKAKSLPMVAEGYYYCKLSKTAKLIPEGYKKTSSGYITRV